MGMSQDQKAKPSLARDLREAAKTLAYLMRAEKYHELALDRGGVRVQPLKLIFSVIGPLREISEIADQLEKGQHIQDLSKFEIFEKKDEIARIARDILELDPKGLVPSDKAALNRLPGALDEIYAKSEQYYYDQAKIRGMEGGVSASAPVQAQPAPAFHPEPFPEIKAPEEPSPVAAQAASPVPEPRVFEPVSVSPEIIPTPPPMPEHFVIPEPVLKPAARKPEPVAAPAPEIQIIYPQDIPSVAPVIEPAAPEIPVSSIPPIPPAPPVIQPVSAIHIQEPLRQFQKYYPTSFAGMNFGEAADIIELLAGFPEDLDLILEQNGSTTQPVRSGVAIVPALRALARLADDLEMGGVKDVNQLAPLKQAEAIDASCKDIAMLEPPHLDIRKKAVLQRYVGEYLHKITKLARQSYPGFFSQSSEDGEPVAIILYRLAKLLRDLAAHGKDNLYGELIAQVVTQIAFYAERNQLKTKLNLVTNQHNLTFSKADMNTLVDKASLQAMLFIPAIARHCMDVCGNLHYIEHRTEIDSIEEGMRFLQLTYINARTHFPETMNEVLAIAAS